MAPDNQASVSVPPDLLGGSNILMPWHPGPLPRARTVLLGVAATSLLCAATIYDPLYGGAAAAVVILTVLLLLAPYVVFYGLVLLLTGWPYYVGIPVGRDLPIPIVLPMICLTYVVVLVRQALRLAPPLPPDPFRARLQLAIALVAASAALSVVASGLPPDGLKSYARAVLMPLLVFLIARHFIRNAVSARTTLDLLLVGAAVGAAYSIYEWTQGLNPLIERFAPPVGDLADRAYWTAAMSGDITLYRSFGFGMNPIFTGTVMAMLMLHAAVRFAGADRAGGKIVFLGLGGLVLGGLVATFSRGPMLAAAVALTLLALGYPSLRKYLLLALGAGATYLAVSVLSDANVLTARLQENDNVTVRLKFWQTAWYMFLENPVIGVGLGQFPEHQLRIVREHAIGPFFEYGNGRLETIKTAEHAILQFVAETGVIGGLAGAFLLGCVLWKLVPAILARRLDPRRDVIVVAGLGIVLALQSGLSVTIYNSWEVGSVVPILLAILCAVPGRDAAAEPWAHGARLRRTVIAGVRP